MLPVYLYDSPTSVSDRALIYFVEFCPGFSPRYHDGEPGHLTFLDENNTNMIDKLTYTTITSEVISMYYHSMFELDGLFKIILHSILYIITHSKVYHHTF